MVSNCDLSSISQLLQQLREADGEIGCLKATLTLLQRDANIIKQQLMEDEQ